jgi:hypothetical protein
MKKKKKLPGAEKFGVKIKVSKELDKYSGKVLFPEKVAIANEMLSKLKK